MRHNLIDRLKEEWNNLDPVDPLRGLIADAIDALAEQPAQQEPVATVTSELGNPNVSMSWWHEPALPVGTKLYTSPPASKPWAGLTDEEIEKLSVESGKATFLNDDEQTDILWFDGDCICLARAIEAKLKEKNK